MKFRLPIASRKKYLPISIILILLMIVALSGYLSAAGDRETSVRILIDDCGGKVVFSHLAHQNGYKISCVKCHHEKGGDQADYIACGLCHPVDFDKNYIGNHKNFFSDKKTCVRCHHLEFLKQALNILSMKVMRVIAQIVNMNLISSLNLRPASPVT